MGVGSGYGMKTLETSGFDLAGGEGEIATQCLVAPTGRGGEDLACELLPNDSLIPHIHTHTHTHIPLLPSLAQMVQTRAFLVVRPRSSPGVPGCLPRAWPPPYQGSYTCSPDLLPRDLVGPDNPCSSASPHLPCCGQAMQISEMALRWGKI